MLNDEAPRILISRLSAIGDCVLTTPVLCALRNRFPKAYIGWIAEPAAATLLTGHACLDQLIVVRKRWFKSRKQVRELRRELLACRFDIAIDPQSLTKSSLVSWLSGASNRIGFNAPRGRELSVWLNRHLVTPTAEHIVDAQLELLKPLGIESPTVEFRLPIQPAAESKIDDLIRAMHLGCGFVMINPGAGWASRRWPAERYGQVARHLGERYQVPSLVLWAAEREHAWAKTIVARSGGHALLAPSTTLPEVAALTRRAHVFLGSDTGPMHIAEAVGTPCVSLHGPTRSEASGPYGPSHIRIQKRYQNGTRRQRRRADNSAMCEIDNDTVVAACERLLMRQKAVPAADKAA